MINLNSRAETQNDLSSFETKLNSKTTIFLKIASLFPLIGIPFNVIGLKRWSSSGSELESLRLKISNPNFKKNVEKVYVQVLKAYKNHHIIGIGHGLLYTALLVGMAVLACNNPIFAVVGTLILIPSVIYLVYSCIETFYCNSRIRGLESNDPQPKKIDTNKIY